MFFAAPVLRHTNFADPRSADAALQRFLHEALTAAPAQATSLQVLRDDKATTLQLDVPGLSREQLNLSIEGSVVRLESVEGAPRQVKRAWELEHEVDLSASKAKLENGVLTLTLAKLAPQSKAVTLSIE